jgi:hypothetical protein
MKPVPLTSIEDGYAYPNRVTEDRMDTMPERNRILASTLRSGRVFEKNDAIEGHEID